MATREALEAELFGRQVQFDYSGPWIAYSILTLRVGMGWILFQAGIVKLLDPSWTAAGYLLNAIPEGNPFGGLWVALAADWLWLIDPLNAWGLTLTGLGLLLGVLVRWSAFWGATIMLFYWASSLTGGLTAGLPVAHGWVVNDHVVYALLLFGLGAWGAGRILGLDAYIEQLNLVQKHPALRYVLG